MDRQPAVRKSVVDEHMGLQSVAFMVNMTYLFGRNSGGSTAPRVECNSDVGSKEPRSQSHCYLAVE